MLESKDIYLDFDDNGSIKKLMFKNDPFKMNWVIDEDYLKDAKYEESNKLFGQFSIMVDKIQFESSQYKPKIVQTGQKIAIIYSFKDVIEVKITYDLSLKDKLKWTIKLINLTNEKLEVNDFGIWLSLAYVMFRDKNVLKNIHNSAAVYPSIATNFTKINAVRRDNVGGNLGIFQIKGKTLSVGTYCAYKNLFFENVSPSLDGMLFHKLILAGGYNQDYENNDWIYDKSSLKLQPYENQDWEYLLQGNQSQSDFYKIAQDNGHPRINYQPLNIIGKQSHLSVQSGRRELTKVLVESGIKGSLKYYLHDIKEKNNDEIQLEFIPKVLGEHKISFLFKDGTVDFIVLNVMNSLDKVIDERVSYISEKLYLGSDGAVPYAFSPISNQGESLGKLNLILKKNLMGTLDVEQVRKVEASAVYYVRNKWFKDGNLLMPNNLYGDFYRCMDFEYIGHLFFLLSEFNNGVLALNNANDYLEWATKVFTLRVDPDLHSTERGKEEAQMLGVYFLYIQELLKKLKNKGMVDSYNKINNLWGKVTNRVNNESPNYKAAITEHFYDNAGFGPTAGALSEARLDDGANRYGELLLANIGYSNDFRAQNPDRWWEALTYMIHSLWGGVTAASTFKVFQELHEINYLNASYRATAAVMYCYDTHSTTTAKLEKGMAASTYAVAGPHINRPDLSRARFGQSTFYTDGGIFARLFDNAEQTPDWDMGEELVAYLDGIGQKTYLIQDGDDLKVINGTYEIDEKKLKLVSFAPYKKEFWLINSNGETLLEELTEEESITLLLKDL
ncbi:hypothetical protein ACVPPR_03835 [Dellaglioa sp. L3N]